MHRFYAGIRLISLSKRISSHLRMETCYHTKNPIKRGFFKTPHGLGQAQVNFGRYFLALQIKNRQKFAFFGHFCLLLTKKGKGLKIFSNLRQISGQATLSYTKAATSRAI